MNTPQPSQATLRSFIYSLVILWLVGASLRITLLAIPPVLPALQKTLVLSQTGIGLLSTLPLLLFAAAAIPGAALIARFGAKKTLLGGLVLTAMAGASRGMAPDTLILFATTLFMGAGIAVMQPAVPPLVRDWAPNNIGLATAIYSNGMLGAEAIAASLTLPFILPMTGNSWRLALVFWSLPVVLTALLLGLRKTKASPQPVSPQHVKVKNWWPDWKDSLTWKLGLMMGCSSSIFFGVNAFLPGYLMQSGQRHYVDGALAAINISQIPPTLILLFFSRHLARRRMTYILAGIFAALGVIGIIAMSGPWVWLWSALTGFCCAFIITLSLTLPALIADPKDIHRIAGAMFTIGYLLAVIMPVIGGISWDASNQPVLGFAPFFLCGGVITVLGISLQFKTAKAKTARS